MIKREREHGTSEWFASVIKVSFVRDCLAVENISLSRGIF